MKKLATWRMGREPFLAVDDPFVADQFGACGEDFGIGTALRFRHREAGDDVVVQERLKIALLLRGRAVVRQNLGVARNPAPGNRTPWARSANVREFH